MLVYSYKGKVCPTSTSSMHNKNIMAILLYNRDVLNKGTSVANEDTLIRQVYNTYSTLCKFNNLLVGIKDQIDKKMSDVAIKRANDKKINAIAEALELLNDYLVNNVDISNQYYDTKIQSIYNELKVCYARLSININSLDSIKKKVVSMMKHYAKLGIYNAPKEGVNLKSNYYDYV